MTINDVPFFVTRTDGVRIAYRYLAGRGPTIIFLPGYMSDMLGGKATAIYDWARDNGRAMLRLDYSGCGESGGDFAEATLSIWRDDILAVMDAVLDGPVILVGSSMGGWLMVMVAEILGDRVRAMVGIAAAPDFTSWGYGDTEKAVIARDGVLYEPNPYGPEPTPIYRKLFDDGQAHLMLNREIGVNCPTRLLHGQCDNDVPWDISVRLAAALCSSDVQLTLVKDGDHRLSRDGDITILLHNIAQLASFQSKD